MADLHTWPFNVGDYLADTTHLSAIEHGAYMLLLMALWRAGGTLPDDDTKLAKVCKLTKGQWKRYGETIKEFCTIENGQLSQSRLTATIEAVRQKSKRQSDNARSKSLKNNDPPQAMAEPNASQNQPAKDKAKDKVAATNGNEGKGAASVLSEVLEILGVTLEMFQAGEALSTASGWERSGFTRRDILDGVQNVVDRHNYELPSKLSYFTGAIEDAQKRRIAKEPIPQEQISEDQWRTTMRLWKKTGAWHGTCAAPGNPGCAVPADILAEFGQPPPTQH